MDGMEGWMLIAHYTEGKMDGMEGMEGWMLTTQRGRWMGWKDGCSLHRGKVDGMDGFYKEGKMEG